MTRRQFLQTVKKFSSNQKIAELVKTKGVQISLQTWKLWMFPNSNYFEDDEYEHIRPIARLFRNTELIGTKFNSEIQGHFVDEEFIAAIYWSNNDVDTLVDKKIEIPVSNTVVATFCKYLETNAIMDDINEENLEEI